jgi:protein SCO1
MKDWQTSIVLLGFLGSLVCSVRAQTLSDEAIAQIRFEQKLNSQVSPVLSFQDEDGKPVRLGQYFGRKPVLLVLGYYECPMLCTLVLNGMVESAEEMKWTIGREFEVVNVSINPNETPVLAAAKKRTYLKRYGRSGAAAGWHFLVGNDTAIRQLAYEVGFHYAYDPASKQYAHPSGLVILTSEGKVSRYLFGVTYSPKVLYETLREASSNKVGSPIQQLLLLCFHYNPITGKYSAAIVIVLRLLGGATILGLLSLIFTLARRGRAAEATLPEQQSPRTEMRSPNGERMPKSQSKLSQPTSRIAQHASRR